MNKQEILDVIKQVENTEYLGDCVDTVFIKNNLELYTDRDADEFREELETYCGEYEVTYHGTAIEFLSKEDPSLRDSLAIACEMCVDISSISSEWLATVLVQQKALEELYGLEIECA